MKVKHFYIVCFVAVLVVLCGSVILVAYSVFESPQSMWQGVSFKGISAAFPAHDLLEDINRLEPLMEALAQPRPRERRGVRLDAFGYREVRPFGFSLERSRLRLKRGFSHSVTFAFCGARKRFCVVDGSFYPEGASLPNGGRILHVTPERILIEEGNIRKWIPVGAGKESSKLKKQEAGEQK